MAGKKMITALHICADGTHELFEYDPRNGLEALQERVGGWLESAPVVLPNLTLYCNEEGKIDGLPYNKRATILLGPDNPDWIAGDVVLVGAPDAEGYDTDLGDIYRDLMSL